MSDVSVMLRPTSSHLSLPSITAPGSYLLSWNTGPDKGRNGAVTVFTDGPNIFGPECWVTDPSGATVTTSGTGGNTVQISVGEMYAINTVYTLHLPCDVSGGARYDYNPPQPKR